MPEIDWDTVPRPQLADAVRAVLAIADALENGGRSGLPISCTGTATEIRTAITAALSVTP